MSNVEKDPTLIHAPGIYFGMDEDIYHADTALGSTDIKALATQPWKWQRDRLRPKDRKVTEDMKWGTALHCRVLEGKEVFEERYAQKPRPEDMGKAGDNVLVTAAHMKAFLKKHLPNLGASTYSKDEMIGIIKNKGFNGPAPIIFDEYLEEWRAKGRVKKELEIDAVKMQEIEDAVYYLENDAILSAIMEAGSLNGGASELSIFYIDEGIRRKARFDYALPPLNQTVSSTIVDLKSFAQHKGADTEEAALHTLAEWDYDIQAIDYLNAYQKAKPLVEAGHIFGDEPFEGFLKQFFNAPSIIWVWAMVHKDGGFQPATLVFNRDVDTYKDDQHFKGAEALCRDAIDNLTSYTDRYGSDKLWLAPQRQPLIVSGDMIPGHRRRN